MLKRNFCFLLFCVFALFAVTTASAQLRSKPKPQPVAPVAPTPSTTPAAPSTAIPPAAVTTAPVPYAVTLNEIEKHFIGLAQGADLRRISREITGAMKESTNLTRDQYRKMNERQDGIYNAIQWRFPNLPFVPYWIEGYMRSLAPFLNLLILILVLVLLVRGWRGRGGVAIIVSAVLLAGFMMPTHSMAATPVTSTIISISPNSITQGSEETITAACDRPCGDAPALKFYLRGGTDETKGVTVSDVKLDPKNGRRFTAKLTTAADAQVGWSNPALGGSKSEKVYFYTFSEAEATLVDYVELQLLPKVSTADRPPRLLLQALFRTTLGATEGEKAYRAFVANPKLQTAEALLASGARQINESTTAQITTFRTELTPRLASLDEVGALNSGEFAKLRDGITVAQATADEAKTLAGNAKEGADLALEGSQIAVDAIDSTKGKPVVRSGRRFFGREKRSDVFTEAQYDALAAFKARVAAWEAARAAGTAQATPVASPANPPGIPSQRWVPAQ